MDENFWWGFGDLEFRREKEFEGEVWEEEEPTCFEDDFQDWDDDYQDY